MSSASLRLFVLAWAKVITVDRTLRRGGFGKLREAVRKVGTARRDGTYTRDEITQAVMGVLRWYRTCSRCLVQSIAIVSLMRTKSRDQADVLMGVQRLPLRSEPPFRHKVTGEFCGHAWVEANGTVVLDDPDFISQYDVIDRF